MFRMYQLPAAFALAAVAAFAAGQPSQDKDAKFGPQKTFRAKTVIGAQVQLKGSSSVGTVEDIIFDDEGVIDYFVVSEKGKLVTVPWEAAQLNVEKRTAVINITEQEFRKIPTYTTEKYPEFYVPTYQAEIYSYYNLKPGQVRRLDRRLHRK
jgi:hypothetical protein